MTCHGAWHARFMALAKGDHQGMQDLCSEAIEEVETLRLRFNASTPRWIPVTERLYEDDGRQVLAVNSVGHFACVTTIYKNTQGKYDGEDATPEETMYPIGDITHWMPLPKGPK